MSCFSKLFVIYVNNMLNIHMFKCFNEIEVGHNKHCSRKENIANIDMKFRQIINIDNCSCN